MREHATTAIGGRLWRALDVRQDEQPSVTWACGMFFITLASASVGLNAADALFFLRNGVETLPLMIMVSGLAVMVATVGYAAGQSALGLHMWSWLVMVIFALWLVLERLGITTEAPGTYPAVWLTGQVIMYVGFTLLWDVAGEIADARQAKRLFPIMTSAGIAGAVTGNALTGPLASALGAENLLLVQAAGLGVAGVLAKITTARFVTRREAASSVIGDLATGWRTTTGMPLFRLVAGVGAALSVLFFLVFFPFSESAAAAFDTEESLAGFLGLFSSIATAATFLVSLLLANRLFARFGVVAVLGIVAVVYVAGFAAWLVAFGLVTATVFRAIQWVAINALAGPAFSSLFNVLTGTRRAQVRDFVSAVPVQAGTVAAGAILLLGAELSDMARTAISLAIAAGFALLVVRMRAAYAAALVDAVRSGLSEVFTAYLPGLQKPRHDADTLAAISAATRDPSAGRRRVAAAILGEVGGDAALKGLRALLGDPDASVRWEALGGLTKLESETLPAEAVGCIDDPSIRVRRRAVALLRSEQRDVPAVNAALDDADFVVRAHAARVIGGRRGLGVINAMLDSNDSDSVAAALECVLAEPSLAEVDADRFVDHNDHRVRAMAASLLRLHAGTTATLTRMLDDTSSDVRSAAADALLQVDSSATLDVLENGSVRAREAVLQTLVADGTHREHLRAWASTELDRATQLQRWRTAIDARTDGASIAAQYLARVLQRREQMVERWVVTALGSDETREVVPVVARGAISGDPEVKAEALEALESLVDRPLARRLSALLESGREEEPTLYRLEVLQRVAADQEYWFRALAARAMFDELSHDLLATSGRAGADTSSVVRTAIPPHELHREDGGFRVVDAVLALQQAPIFGHLDPEDLEAVAALGIRRTYQPGEVAYNEGSAADELMMITSGRAIVSKADGDNRRVLAERGPGEPIGELGVLRSSPRTADVIAGPEGLQSFVIEAGAFTTLLAEQPGIATAMLAQLAERIASTVDPAGVTMPES